MYEFLDFIILGNSIFDYLKSLSFMLLGLLLGWLISFLSKTVFKNIVDRTESKNDDVVLEILKWPLILFAFSFGFYLAYKTLHLPNQIYAILGSFLKIIYVFVGVKIITSFVDAFIVSALVSRFRGKSRVDTYVVDMVKKVVKFIIYVIALIMVVSLLGYNITSLVAGLGIGGLAIALAAQELLGNLFGGVAIVADKPFRVGNRIKFAGQDGFVRAIGVRTTLIETFDGTVLTVPNKIITNEIVENVSKEKARRMKFSIGITYETSSKKLDDAMNIIKDIVLENKNTEDESKVYFGQFADSALIINIIYWIKVDCMDQYFETQNDINIAIKRRFEKAKIDMAYPTQTLWLKK
jgi:MscS family membrane protein